MSSTTPRTLFIVAAAFIAGCGSDSPSAPSSPLDNRLDLAAVLSQMSLGNVNTIHDVNVGVAAMPGAAVPTAIASPAIMPASCTYTPATGGFSCPQRTANGITFAVSYFLYDAGGHSLTTPDASVVASVRAVTDASGSLTLAAGSTGSAAFTDHEDMTLSGLLTATRTLNGTGKSNFDMSITAPVQLRTVLNQTSATANLVLPSSANGASSWPQSGTITSDIQATSSAAGLPGVTLPIHTVVTFNGTSTITAATSSGSFGVTCTIDLSGKTVPHCSFGQ